MEMTKREKEILEKHFSIYEDESIYEIEKWTDGGVDMIISFDKKDNKSITEQFSDYIKNFDVDEEIELYRENKEYRENFTCRESVKDFESWEKFIKKVLEELEVK